VPCRLAPRRGSSRSRRCAWSDGRPFSARAVRTSGHKMSIGDGYRSYLARLVVGSKGHDTRRSRQQVFAQPEPRPVGFHTRRRRHVAWRPGVCPCAPFSTTDSGDLPRRERRQHDRHWGSGAHGRSHLLALGADGVARTLPSTHLHPAWILRRRGLPRPGARGSDGHVDAQLSVPVRFGARCGRKALRAIPSSDWRSSRPPRTRRPPTSSRCRISLHLQTSPRRSAPES
jgi:hypothetical protein